MLPLYFIALIEHVVGMPGAMGDTWASKEGASPARVYPTPPQQEGRIRPSEGNQDHIQSIHY